MKRGTALRRAPMTAGDLLVVLTMLVVAAISAMGSKVADDRTPLRLRVSGVDTAPREYLLYQGAGRRELRVEGPLGISVLVIDNGRARLLSAPCAQQVCVDAGWLTDPGDLAVCVPNQLVLRVIGRRADGIDAITR